MKSLFFLVILALLGFFAFNYFNSPAKRAYAYYQKYDQGMERARIAGLRADIKIDREKYRLESDEVLQDGNLKLVVFQLRQVGIGGTTTVVYRSRHYVTLKQDNEKWEVVDRDILMLDKNGNPELDKNGNPRKMPK